MEPNLNEKYPQKKKKILIDPSAGKFVYTVLICIKTAECKG